MAGLAGGGRLNQAFRIALCTLGLAWAAPYTVLGLLAGTAGLAFGAQALWRRHDMAVVFHRMPWGPGGALTLGNVILHTGDSLDSACMTYAQRAGHGDEPSIVLADHERAHVLQYMALGPLFLPVYLACGGVSVRNRFERAADRYAQTGRGWWPWPEPGQAATGKGGPSKAGPNKSGPTNGCSS